MSIPILSTSTPIAMSKGLHKAPHCNSVVQKNAANRGNSAISLQPYVTWDFEFDMDAVQGNEALASSVLAEFWGTFMACQGQTGLFLFRDLQDNTVSYANSGMLDVTAASTTPMASTGNGVSTQFQLARSIGGAAWDIIQNLNGSITVKVNGSVVTNYSVSSTGVVTFTLVTSPPLAAAPPNGATLQWAGSFYYLCRFDADTVDSIRIFTVNNGTDLWNLSSIKFASEFV